MSTLVLTDLTTLVGGYDMTGDSNEAELSVSVEELETTTFGDPATGQKGRTRIAGLEDVESTINGYWQSGDDAVDPHVFSNLGTALLPITQCPRNLEGAPAYMYRARTFTYQVGGEVGQVLPFELTISGAVGNGQVGVVRGRLAARSQAVSQTGPVGTALELGEVAEGQHLYATFHVLSAGTTITALVESDVNSDFSSPTTQMSIGPVTAQGGVWATRVAGPITDTHYRLNVSAITDSFVIAGAIGIR